MLDFYYWPTPNGWKIAIMLEECDLPYDLMKVNIGQGDQFKPEFLKISPNNKVPAIVDRDAVGGPLSIFESGAVLLYLAERSGQFMPVDERLRWEVIQWVTWQVANLGPMIGQLEHFTYHPKEKLAYPVERYKTEFKRLLGVLNRQLDGREFIVGEYSIADMAAWPWLRTHQQLEQPLDEFPNVARWFQAMAARPAVQRACQLGLEWFSK